MIRLISFLSLLLVGATSAPGLADSPSLEVTLDTSETPHLRAWGEDARELIHRWQPRLMNLLATKPKAPANRITLKIRNSNKGVGSTSRNIISVSSHWIEKHPEDLGLVFHELVHVVQGYPSGDPWWLTEGIADYLRWAIYEGKDLAWFPRPKVPKGYRKGYRVAAGFLLWLEIEHAPGIVKRLHNAMRNREYSDELFQLQTGQQLNELWAAYSGQEVKQEDETSQKFPTRLPEELEVNSVQNRTSEG
ncbi:MAG TPA: hypothetical protein DDW52_28680 [Planctomycetaceae bacterium]|nr:hypothetical protein [Planctomycetaceae bacterium]